MGWRRCLHWTRIGNGTQRGVFQKFQLSQSLVASWAFQLNGLAGERHDGQLGVSALQINNNPLLQEAQLGRQAFGSEASQVFFQEFPKLPLPEAGSCRRRGQKRLFLVPVSGHRSKQGWKRL